VCASLVIAGREKSAAGVGVERERERGESPISRRAHQRPIYPRRRLRGGGRREGRGRHRPFAAAAAEDLTQSPVSQCWSCWPGRTPPSTCNLRRSEILVAKVSSFFPFSLFILSIFYSTWQCKNGGLFFFTLALE
jgi:hypothetical protein